VKGLISGGDIPRCQNIGNKAKAEQKLLLRSNASEYVRPAWPVDSSGASHDGTLKFANMAQKNRR